MKTSLENITSFYLWLCDYFNSLNLWKNSKLTRNQIGLRSGLRVKKENEKFTVVCSRSPENLEFSHFMLLFCRGQQRNVAKFKTHVQSDWFCSLNLLSSSSKGSFRPCLYGLGYPKTTLPPSYPGRANLFLWKIQLTIYMRTRTRLGGWGGGGERDNSGGRIVSSRQVG